MTEPLPEAEIAIAKLHAAVIAVGEALADMGTLLTQGIRDDNQAKRGSIAVGLERAAAYVRGKEPTS